VVGSVSSKHKTPKKPENKLTTRGDIINFANFLSSDEAFCLRVWNTVQAVHERALKSEAGSVPEITGLSGDAEVATQTLAEPEAVPA
jgi:hypothetical protein